MKNTNRGLSLGWIAGISGGLFLTALFLPGCGGSAPTSSATGVALAASGRAVFMVVWPAASTTRLIPLAARSIRVDVLRSNGTVVASQLLARADTGSSAATLTFTNLPVETLTARATALPQTDGSGTAQATGTVPLVIQAGQTVSFSLTMASTVDHLDINAVAVPFIIGQKFQMTETARDAPGTSGNIVLTASAKMQWVSSNTAVVSVDESGLVTALSAGTATVTVTDQESGKSVSATVTVAPPADPFAGVHQYLTLDLTSLSNYANPVFPVHYDANVRGQNNVPNDNPVTDRGATLGRVLFYDKRLSVKDTVACASCHQQAIGMTDSQQFSTGFNGASFTTAHAMRLGNIRFYTGASMFWNKRAANVETQASQPLQNSIEMGFDASNGGLNALIQKMSALPYYPELFQWVYGDSAITEDRVQKALAQYERSMVSTNSRFDTEFAKVYNPALGDRGIAAPFAGYTAQEARGKQLYLLPPNQGGAGCVTCHQVPTFALAANSRSNGLDAGETTVFKSPSLKNIGITGPYMHDGRFTSLEQVVDHYISGVQNGPALDNRLKNGAGQPQRLNLATADRDALVAFLRTLTDNTLTSDPKFTNPFRN